MENLKIAVGRISVATPFSREFIAAARSISGLRMRSANMR